MKFQVETIAKHFLMFTNAKIGTVQQNHSPRQKNKADSSPHTNTRAQIHVMRLDLWNTTLTHLCTPVEPSPVETCTCICCLRPILRHALHTRTFQWYDDSMHVVVGHSPVLAYCPIYREQVFFVMQFLNQLCLCLILLNLTKRTTRRFACLTPRATTTRNTFSAISAFLSSKKAYARWTRIP